MDALQQRLLGLYQRGVPVSPRPYADMADQVGAGENEVIEALRALTESRLISRVGPIFESRRVGASTLAAMQVSEPRLRDVAALVSSYPEVNHNYEREHTINLWFVVTAADEQRLQEILSEIEQRTDIPVMSLPMQEVYHIDLGFDLTWN